MNIQIDVSDIDNTEDKVKTLDNTISQMQNYKTTLDVDSSQVDDANAVIQYCVTQKQMEMRYLYYSSFRKPRTV